MIWYMIWYDMIWYDMIWYDMIWYKIIEAVLHCISTHIAPHFPQKWHNSKCVTFSGVMTQPLFSSEFGKLRYDTIPVKSASPNVSFYTNNSKMPNFELWHSCRKQAIYIYIYIHFFFSRTGKVQGCVRYKSHLHCTSCKVWMELIDSSLITTHNPAM